MRPSEMPPEALMRFTSGLRRMRADADVIFGALEVDDWPLALRALSDVGEAVEFITMSMLKLWDPHALGLSDEDSLAAIEETSERYKKALWALIPNDRQYFPTEDQDA